MFQSQEKADTGSIFSVGWVPLCQVRGDPHCGFQSMAFQRRPKPIDFGFYQHEYNGPTGITATATILQPARRTVKHWPMTFSALLNSIPWAGAPRKRGTLCRELRRRLTGHPSHLLILF